MEQKGFSRLWDGFKTDQEAKQARDAHYKQLKTEGKKCKRHILKNQLKKYDSLGCPNGGICDVYMITIWD